MAYISTEDVKRIREQLKKELPNLKFGVRRDNSHAVLVRIISGDINFFDDENMVSKDGYQQINQYHLYQYGDHKDVLQKIVDIIKTAPEKQFYDNSDSMIDYFDIAFYFRIQIGDWNKPYVCTAKKEIA